MAFAECTNLNKVVFTDKISYVDEEAFYYCTSLNIVELASDMTEDTFGNDCFYNCNIYEIKNLSAMELEPQDSKCEGLTDNAIHIYVEGESLISRNGDFVLMNLEGEVYLLSYAGSETTVTVPEGVTVIYTQAFNSSNVTKLILSSTVKEIGDYAFYDNYDIEEVVCNEGLEKIGYQAFRYSSLTTINIPSTVTEVGDQAFNGSSLTGVITLGENLSSVGYRAFYTSYPLTFIVIASERPEGWDTSWCRDQSGYATILWGFTGEEITYTFESNGGSAVDNIVSGMPITLPEGPTREGYYFQGWYDNAEFTGAAISGSYYNSEKTTFYAKWMSQAEYDAQFAGTSMENALTLELGTTVNCVIKDKEYGRKYYVFTATESGTYAFYSSCADGSKKDTLGYLYDSTGKQLVKEDYSKEGDYYHFYIEYELEAGQTYYFGAQDYYGSATEFLVTFEKI
jgi:uncharacterized repeat protein (TIGR02543 family)